MFSGCTTTTATGSTTGGARSNSSFDAPSASASASMTTTTTPKRLSASFPGGPQPPPTPPPPASVTSTSTTPSKRKRVMAVLFSKSTTTTTTGESPYSTSTTTPSQPSPLNALGQQQQLDSVPEGDEAEDTAERRALVERAAAERDEKRKKKVTEALQSTHRRLDAAFNAIQAEMDDAIETSKWTPQEKKSALLLFVIISLAAAQSAWALVPYVACVVCMLYSYRQSELKHVEARRGGDNVGARLVDLEDGLRRCELALQHDVEQEEEWTQMVLDEARQWEERQRELVQRRGRVFPYHTQRMRMVSQFHETTDRAKQALHKIEDVARKTLLIPQQLAGDATNLAVGAVTVGSRNPTRDNQSAGGDSEAGADDSSSSAAWRHYVQTNLPLERLAHESEEEQVFSAQLRVKSNGDWDLLPRDLQLMLLRGYADKKDRMKESLDGLKYILDWRRHTQCDTILQTATEEHRNFFRAWGTVYAGEDRYGHVIIADRVETINLPQLFALEDDFILHMRTKQMEVLRRIKHQIEHRRGERVCRHIYMLDLSGLNVRKHFTPRVKHLLQSIFKVGGDAYPDSMWQMWLINTPFVFQLVWKALSPTIDPTTKSKIRMLGGKDKYLPEMHRCGIPIESIPSEFGGQAQSRNFFCALEDFIQADKATAAAARAQEEDEKQASIRALPSAGSSSLIM